MRTFRSEPVPIPEEDWERWGIEANDDARTTNGGFHWWVYWALWWTFVSVVMAAYAIFR